MTLFPEAQKAEDYLDLLIDTGEKLSNVTSHPGMTRDFVEWKNKVDTFVQRRYGVGSPFWGRIAEIVCIPKWFNNSIHGTGSEPDGTGKPIAFVVQPSMESERKTAFKLYKNGILQIVAILKSLKEDIEVNGLPNSSSSTLPSPAQIFQTNISPSFSQSQTQSQEQTVALHQNIGNLLKIVEEKYGEESAAEAKQLLSDLEKNSSKWSTVEKVITFFLKLGRDAFVSLLPLLMQILLKNH